MKRILCRICAVCLLAIMLCTALTGCGSFFSEEALQIEDVVCTPLGDGSIRLTITYVDDVKEPDVYTIPKGNVGDEGPSGNGIENITSEYDAAHKQTVLTITYTDKANFPDQELVIPDGISIVAIDDVYDEITGTHTLTFVSSNPEICQFEPISIPKGEKGDKGNGINVEASHFEPYTKTDDNGIVTETGIRYTFVFDDGKETSIDIPNPNGVQSIEGTEDGESYILTITYTTGEKMNIPFNRPKDPNKWISGGNVNDLTPLFGADGDFFFDTVHKDIWLKENGSWTKIVSFKSDTFTVEFDVNDDEENPASMNGSTRYTVPAGSYLISSVSGYDIPRPERPGYKFLGWYTKKTVDTVTMSPFTDLTPITADLRLYANWEKID